MSLTTQYQFKPGQSRCDLSVTQSTVLPEKGVTLSYPPNVIFIDSSTEITSLVLSVSNMKLCQTEKRFKVDFFVAIS